jgi:hypothetical protein
MKTEGDMKTEGVMETEEDEGIALRWRLSGWSPFAGSLLKRPLILFRLFGLLAERVGFEPTVVGS